MTAEFWEYDARLGRRWNLDPKPITFLSLYAVFKNNPIWLYDIKGDSAGPVRTANIYEFKDKPPIRANSFNEMLFISRQEAWINPAVVEKGVYLGDRLLDLAIMDDEFNKTMESVFENLNKQWIQKNFEATTVRNPGMGVSFGGILDPSKSVLRQLLEQVYVGPFDDHDPISSKEDYASLGEVFNDELTWVLRHADLQYKLTKEVDGSVHGTLIIKDRFNLDTHNGESEYNIVVWPLDKIYRYILGGNYFDVRGYISLHSPDGKYQNVRYRLHGQAPRGQMMHPGKGNNGTFFDLSPILMW